jgi:hypothetical protein
MVINSRHLPRRWPLSITFMSVSLHKGYRPFGYHPPSMTNGLYSLLSANSLQLSLFPILLSSELSYTLPSLRRADITRSVSLQTSCLATLWLTIKLLSHPDLVLSLLLDISYLSEYSLTISHYSTYTQPLWFHSPITYS